MVFVFYRAGAARDGFLQAVGLSCRSSNPSWGLWVGQGCSHEEWALLECYSLPGATKELDTLLGRIVSPVHPGILTPPRSLWVLSAV